MEDLPVTLEMWNSVWTFGTFFVIAATAIAAIVQLRHMRGGNQIAALTELRSSQETPRYVRALHFVYGELPKKLQDPAFRYQLGHRSARTVEFHEMISNA